MELLFDNIRNLERALEFFDQVEGSSEDERVAVGRDHYDWVFTVARKIVSSKNCCPIVERPSREEAIEIIKEMREEDATSEHIAMALGFGEGNEE